MNRCSYAYRAPVGTGPGGSIRRDGANPLRRLSGAAGCAILCLPASRQTDRREPAARGRFSAARPGLVFLPRRTMEMGRMRSGGCQCGEVRYESAGQPLAVYVCHCRECQKQSASAFGMSLEVPRAGLRVTRGAPKYWMRAADSGRRLKCAFCPACGSRLWHETESGSETVMIKVGSLDEPVDISAAIHIWTSRKLPGIAIPDGVRQFPKELG